VTLSALDASGTAAAGYRGTVRFTATDAGATLPSNYTFTAADAGSHTFASAVTLRTTGSQTVTAIDTADAAITGSQTVQVASSGGSSLRVTTGSSSWTAGVSNSVTVSARDGSGNVMTGYRGMVRFTSTDPIATLPASYTFTAADAGSRVFTGVTLRTARLQTITATDAASSSLTGSLSVTVAPGEASGFKITGVPSPFPAGSTSDVTVTSVDTWDNVASGYTGTVRFTSTDPLAVLPANYGFTPSDQGVHTFAKGLSLKTAGSQSVKVSDSVVAFLAGSQTIVVTASATGTAAPAR
jgi:hypothetical protein